MFIPFPTSLSIHSTHSLYIYIHSSSLYLFHCSLYPLHSSFYPFIPFFLAVHSIPSLSLSLSIPFHFSLESFHFFHVLPTLFLSVSLSILHTIPPLSLSFIIFLCCLSPFLCFFSPCFFIPYSFFFLFFYSPLSHQSLPFAFLSFPISYPHSFSS
ncbi:unnamed protein product [Acanthosepion pharaonis]|uniref:Uncharacterized protein n=1 Tax=Acanthosepion pharaonis TaxID=158019 RepID=A0A812D8P9_ACAPH|nr:unnamed protein product [Sepia pharaonis]